MMSLSRGLEDGMKMGGGVSWLPIGSMPLAGAWGGAKPNGGASAVSRGGSGAEMRVGAGIGGVLGRDGGVFSGGATTTGANVPNMGAGACTGTGAGAACRTDVNGVGTGIGIGSDGGATTACASGSAVGACGAAIGSGAAIGGGGAIASGASQLSQLPDSCALPIGNERRVDSATQPAKEMALPRDGAALRHDAEYHAAKEGE